MGGWAFPGSQLPGDDAGDGRGPLPGGACGDRGAVAGDDADDGHFEWLVREMDAGRLLPPPQYAAEGPAVSVSLGDACDLDPGLLAAVCGPDGLGGQAALAAFGEGKAVDTLRPGPVLAALTAQAVSRVTPGPGLQTGAAQGPSGPGSQPGPQRGPQAGLPPGPHPAPPPGPHPAPEPAPLTDDELVGVLQATRRLANLPGAAYADAALAAAAPGLRLDQLAHKAEALEKKLAPEAVKARRELARHLGQRVEARREESGNASLAGRELDTADVIASKAYIDALAARLRGSGLFAGPVGRLRALVLTDLTQGRNPLDRITARPAPAPEAAERPDTASPDSGARPLEQPDSAPPGRDTEVSGTPVTGHDEQATVPPGSTPGADGDPLACLEDEEDEQSESPWRGPASGDPVPLPALVNLLVPAGTLLGWGTAPARAAGWGLLDPDETQALVRAASRHPRTRWCMTIIAPDGTALAHGCAAGQHPWPPNDPPPPPPPGNPPGPRPRPDPPPQHTPGTPGGPGDAPSRSTGTPGGSAEAPSPQQAAELLGLLRRLNITLESIATDACGHAYAEDRYVPSRKLKHLIHARNQTCTAPACNAQAQHCDLDHTVPYPDGPTDECNLNPKCRRHHRTKQAPGWNAAQPAPGTATWTTPSGRTHTTTATTYDL